MRDPMSWALPVYRLFGIQVKVHVFFLVITLGLFLRQVADPKNVVAWETVLLFTVGMLFAVVLLHEYGHCYGGKRVGGEPSEILIWPLGGLAFVDVPHHPRAHLVTVAAGPAVNAGLGLFAAAALVLAGFWPNANPLPWSEGGNPYLSELKGFDGRLYTSEYGARLYHKGSAEPVRAIPADVAAKWGKPAEFRDAAREAQLDWAVAPPWVVWVQRFFWLNWVLLLFNLLPAYPLDGGQLLQGFVWARTSYRQGTTVAAYAGYGVAVVFLIAAIAVNEALLLGLGLFMLYASWVRLHAMEAEEGVYGDFSQGYLSLDRDEPPPRPRKANFLKRWLQARAARRLQREIEQRQAEDERMDELLDKIAKYGKAALTDEERRFMERVSARYRNR